MPQHDHLIPDRSRGSVWGNLPLVLAGYFLLNFIVRMALPHVLELDEGEQIYFTQWLLGGYSSQPPFYNWLQYAVNHTFGISLAALSGLKNVMLFASYLFYWLAARQVTGNKTVAVVAALGLLTVPQIAFEAQRDLSHTVATIFASSFFFYAALRTLKSPSLAAYLLLGLATGVGGIAKYNFVVLPLATFAAILIDNRFRPRVFDWRILLAGVIALLIVLPHGLWLVDHFAQTSGHTMKKMVSEKPSFLHDIVEGFGSLALASLGFAALTLVVIGLCFREHLKAVLRARSEWTRLVGRILLFSLGIIVLLVLFAGVDDVRDRWLTPVLIGLPLYLALKIDAAGVALQPGLKRFRGVAFVIMALIPLILIARTVSTVWTGNYSYKNYPFVAFTDEIRQKIGSVPTLVVAQTEHFSGNMRFYLPGTPVMSPVAPTDVLTFPLPPHDQIVFVWRGRDGGTPGEFPKMYRDYLASRGITDNGETQVLGYPYSYGKGEDRFQFAYRVVRTTP